MDQLKILHVVPSFGLGGMERIICALVNRSSDSFHHSILSLDEVISAAKWIGDQHTEVVGFVKPKERMEYFRALYRNLKTTAPDLLMTYNWGATDAIWLGRLAGIPRILHSEHGFNVDEGSRTQWKRDAVRLIVYRLASKIIVVSQELQTLMRQRYLLTDDQVILIPNGIDTSHYRPEANERRQTRKMLGFGEDDLVVGFCGRLDPVKNLPLLLEIFAYCVRKEPRWRLLIVGDGPEKNKLDRFCIDRKLSDKVVLTGQQENALPFLRAMDVFLLTSVREQMPVTVLEAMALGTPVVAAKVGEIPRMVDDGINGIVIDAGTSVKTFAQSMFSLLPEPRRKSWGTAARQKVIDHFQEQSMVQRYKTLIQELGCKFPRDESDRLVQKPVL